MKKTNDHAEPTKVKGLKVCFFKNSHTATGDCVDVIVLERFSYRYMSAKESVTDNVINPIPFTISI